MQDIIYIILFPPALLIGTLTVLFMIAGILVWIDKKINPQYPFCDIDPKCHIAFIWDKDGVGWIGHHKVIGRRTNERCEENPYQ